MSGAALRVVHVVDAVAEGLREAILGGEFTPGEPLTEAALSQRFGVPRPTVRSAVQAVMQDGLVRREPNRSVYVPVLTAADIKDLFAVRRLLEAHAVEQLVARQIQPRQALRALRMLESLDAMDEWSDVVRYDFDLHQALVDAAGSPRMSRVYASNSAEIRLALTQLKPLYSTPADIAQEHRELLAAVESGDGELAVGAIREHLDTSERLILEQLPASRDRASARQ